MRGNKKNVVKDNVNMGYEMSDKGRVIQNGRSEGGWIMGENGFHTADPRWVGEKDAISSTGSNERVQQAKSVVIRCGTKAKVALGSTKVRKPKKKLPAMPTVGTGRGSRVDRGNSDVGGFARTMAAVERDGFALFPGSFNTTWHCLSNVK